MANDRIVIGNPRDYSSSFNYVRAGSSQLSSVGGTINSAIASIDSKIKAKVNVPTGLSDKINSCILQARSVCTTLFCKNSQINAFMNITNQSTPSSVIDDKNSWLNGYLNILDEYEYAQDVKNMPQGNYNFYDIVNDGVAKIQGLIKKGEEIQDGVTTACGHISSILYGITGNDTYKATAEAAYDEAARDSTAYNFGGLYNTGFFKRVDERAKTVKHGNEYYNDIYNRSKTIIDIGANVGLTAACPPAGALYFGTSSQSQMLESRYDEAKLKYGEKLKNYTYKDKLYAAVTSSSKGVVNGITALYGGNLIRGVKYSSLGSRVAGSSVVETSAFATKTVLNGIYNKSQGVSNPWKQGWNDEGGIAGLALNNAAGALFQIGGSKLKMGNIKRANASLSEGSKISSGEYNSISEKYKTLSKINRLKQRKATLEKENNNLSDKLKLHENEEMLQRAAKRRREKELGKTIKENKKEIEKINIKMKKIKNPESKPTQTPIKPREMSRKKDNRGNNKTKASADYNTSRKESSQITDEEIAKIKAECKKANKRVDTAIVFGKNLWIDYGKGKQLKKDIEDLIGQSKK